MLDAIGPWIGTIGPLPLLFIALARGWLLTPAAMQKAFESQEARALEAKANADARVQEIKDNAEARVADAKEREKEWRDKTAEALEIVQMQSKQLDVVTELGETSVKLLEAVHGAKFGLTEEQKARKTTHVVRPGREG